MKEPKILKTEKEYNEALKKIEFLMEKDSPDKRDIDELELFGTLVSMYEEEKWPISQPHPVDAILFRIEQLGLTRTDLEKYIGPKSKVSEVLSGKRSLSKQMIINLHAGLGIPLESLIGGKEESDVSIDVSCEDIEWMKFPVKEMIKRRWITFKVKDDTESYHAAMKSFASGLGSDLLTPAMHRSSQSYSKKPDPYALTAWRIRILSLARKEKLEIEFNSSLITASFGRELAKLSYLDKGPLLAREFLNKNGIHLIIEKHLEHTYLDGAAMMLADGTPVIALTLRNNRLDNFWFVLFHELAHIALHLSFDNTRYFLEDLDDVSDASEEKEADRWALDALIDAEIWKASGLTADSKYEDILNFSANLRISPAIPAGRLRRESGNYQIFARLVGNGKVRSLFEND